MLNNKKIDFLIIFYYILLVGCGWLSIYIADFHFTGIGFRHENQQLWIGFSAFAALFILLLNKRFFIDFAYHYYVFLLLVLIAVMLFGTEINGAKSWFQFGSFKIQPAEFAKIASCLALAKFLDSINRPLSDFKEMCIAMGIVAIPLLLIVLQHDVGSALVYCSFFIPLYRQGFSPVLFIIATCTVAIAVVTLKWGSIIVILAAIIIGLLLLFPQLNKRQKNLLPFLSLPIFLYFYLQYLNEKPNEFALLYSVLLYISLLFFILFNTKGRNITSKSIQKTLNYLATVGAMIFSFSVSYLFNNLLFGYQKDRILAVIGESKELYNTMHAKIAVSLGGFWGTGFLNGNYTKLEYVPEQETDFIFTTIGETYGFVGCTLIILLFFLFMMRLITIAERQTATFSRVYAYSITGIFFFHFMINIGMAIGLLPVIGIPLPFFSYGGSSLLAFTILLFILIKLDIHRADRVI